MLKDKTIGFIGGGNMAEALIKGLLGGACRAKNIVVSDPARDRLSHLETQYGVATAADNSQLARSSNIVILAVKPQVMSEVLSECAGAFDEQTLLVSILAGIDTRALEGQFGKDIRVIRTMPNTPALVSEGATALCPGKFAAKDDLAEAAELFETVGRVVTVSEAQMDAVTGLSGSGPAYVFAFIEALADGGVFEGLPRETALTLATQTVLGAAHLVRESGEHPAQLKDRVCSPGGTTICGVQALEERGFRGTVLSAVSAASRRSRRLGGRE